ncbi:MAG: 4-hydroxy-3-methylbut-2-enyl diphosphate reductase [Acidimicrobiales bacterium]
MEVDKVLLAEPRGFCAGVEKAIKALAWMVRVFEPPVFCYHEIVHNQLVVDEFRSLGVVFVDDIAQVPQGAPLMLSAHGTAPSVLETARATAALVIDAVCPLVTKVHHELKTRSAKGYQVLYVGHAGHEEAVGTMAVAPDSVHLVESEEDLDALEGIEADTPVALLAQTTLSHDEWRGLKEAALARFKDLWLPGRSDLCFATTNRQAALREIATRVDAVVVIGSANSSNTTALEKVARASGCARVVRVDASEELPDDLAGVVGVTAGASAPEQLVREVLAALSPENGVEVVHVTEEDEYFPPPPELRDLLKALAATISLLNGRHGSTSGDRSSSDRDSSAAQVLGALTAGQPRLSVQSRWRSRSDDPRSPGDDAGSSVPVEPAGSFRTRR